MIIIIFTLVMLPVPISPYIKILIWFILYYGLTKGENSYWGKVVSPINYIGYLYQTVSTSNPEDKELEVALVTMKRILELEDRWKGKLEATEGGA